MTKQVHIIGGGLAGLTAASLLAKAGHKVTLLEKNQHFGGRLNHFQTNGFTFDMGPSWYWMPDIFEKFYQQFGHTASDFYDLRQLSPGFKVFFKQDSPIVIPGDKDAIVDLFESIEKGAGKQLNKFLLHASEKYRLSVNRLIYQPSLSWTEFITADVVKGFAKYSLLKPFNTYVAGHFKDERLRQIMEFPVLFLGAKSKNIPSLYSMMHHAAFNQGTFYPMGGMLKIAEAFTQIALEQGVELIADSEVKQVTIQQKNISSLLTMHSTIASDGVICAADYHHFEQQVLPESSRRYDESYWDKRILSPSALLFFIGTNKKMPQLEHHNLFFDADFESHSEAIYDSKEWPKDPLFYVCCPSKTDHSVAPYGSENLFLLVPIAPGLEDTESMREQYFNTFISRMEKHCGVAIREHIVYKKSYCIKDFKEDYHSYKGNAYGLANSLSQTAVLKPSMVSTHIDNLVYAGQLTVPGPGLPPAIISGEIAAQLMNQKLKNSI